MHKKLFAAVGILTLFAACSTSKISIRKDALREMKSVAVMPFTSTVADAKVTRECTELFRGSMLSGGFQVVEREKIDKILKEKELAQSGLVDNKAIEAGQFLGAQGTMLGEITAHEVKSDTIEAELPLDGPGKYDPRLDKGDGVFSQREVRPGEKRWYKKDKRDTFQFQIVVRLISNVDGQTVLTLQNEYPVRTYTADSGSLRPANLDQFRAQVLAQMAKDIEKALKEAREP
ncbi:MAG: hypothetical protein J0L53_03855 [Spirochaetes bacterium]|nr:hypothetical protein [Spirochaetota bacterium]MBX3723236.1 hypothetical protein [Turneriella sp.]